MDYREIPGYEDKYAITEDGDIMNLRTGHIKTQTLMSNGYKCVNLGHNNLQLISRLVALTYIPNPDNKPQIDHIDRNPLNNNVKNLRWVSAAENLANKGTYKNSPYNTKYINKGRKGKFRVRFKNINREFESFKGAQAFLCSQLLSESRE